jgi:pyruvate dehydrogenase E1 component alpha subunit
VCEAPSTTVTVTKDELLAFFKEMYTMRRVEISNDTEYKVSQFFR